MNWACELGDLETVKKLGLPKDSFAIAAALAGGHLHIIKYLVSINSPIDDWIISNGIAYGQFEIVKYLISINAPLNEWAVYNAISVEWWDIAKYLIIMGAWYESTSKIEELKKELREEFNPVVSEFVGPDIASIILQFLI